MLHERYNLTEDGRVYMNTYIHDRSPQIWDNMGQWQPEKRPAVVILPGGAYRYCSDREAEPVALAFLNAGFQAFVLYYSVADDSTYPAPLLDVSKALWEIRKHADQWNIDKDKIAVGGFSAGGNLAALLGTQWNNESLFSNLMMPTGANKPNAIFPCYALVSLEEGMLKPAQDGIVTTVPGSIMTEPPPEINVHHYVDIHTPPAFIWHTFEDEILTVYNPLSLATAYAKKNIPFELHIFQYGPHGTSLNNDVSSYGLPQPINVDTWVPLCIKWLKAQFNF